MSEVLVGFINERCRCDVFMCGNAADARIRFVIGGTTVRQSKKVDLCVTHLKDFAKKVTETAVALGVKKEELFP